MTRPVYHAEQHEQKDTTSHPQPSREHQQPEELHGQQQERTQNPAVPVYKIPVKHVTEESEYRREETEDFVEETGELTPEQVENVRQAGAGYRM